MPENKLIDPDTAATAGRQLIDTALQRNPVIAIATALVVPLLSLFRRRGRTAASVEKMKLESYRYQPVDSTGRAGTAPGNRQVGHSMGSRGSQEGFPSSECDPRTRCPTPQPAQKGGRRHG
ncbi:hypothetical protein [Opitutus terrae]|uniref:Uncharacterized protein n=1 Tax=Opitutus terrae (strain DSM 11246 / JCM 15787 / PB90-1) TaxID=452637 RepID=B1ZV57_OPITP|nr:hypothetical protein [Opitutus terrae]ACB76724.1 hypothetical protein Oter_3447 [Opitutus terrae PB90-1]